MNDLTVPGAASEREAGSSIRWDFGLLEIDLPILTTDPAWPTGSPWPSILREIPLIYTGRGYSVFYAIRPMAVPIKLVALGLQAKYRGVSGVLFL
jgi:hypothetical protein